LFFFASGTRHNGLDTTEQERLVELLRDADDNTTRVEILEEAIALSLENKVACSKAEEYMEERIIKSLNGLRKYETAGVYFEADPEQGMHNNLVAAKQFLLLDKYAAYLPEMFGECCGFNCCRPCCPNTSYKWDSFVWRYSIRISK
jgi:hypothetical protein